MTFVVIIDRWPTISAFAEDTGVPYERARAWRLRNSIPSRYWDDVIAAAKAREIRGVDLGVLHAAERAKYDGVHQDAA